MGEQPKQPKQDIVEAGVTWHVELLSDSYPRLYGLVQGQLVLGEILSEGGKFYIHPYKKPSERYLSFLGTEWNKEHYKSLGLAVHALLDRHTKEK